MVQADETEQGERRLLNFGHTLGHALENEYQLMHGEAVAIGMGFAAQLSKALLGFREPDRVVRLIERYGLPASLSFDRERAVERLRMDKKRERSTMNYVLLNRIGRGQVVPIPMAALSEWVRTLP